jgi:hypothetical protein
MPEYLLGSTRAALMDETISTKSTPDQKIPGKLVKIHRDMDRLLQFFIFNEDSLHASSL